MNKKLYYAFLINILPALFLTKLVDTITLTTFLHRIVIFGYFIMGLGVTIFFLYKRTEELTMDRYNLFYMVLIVISLSGIFVLNEGVYECNVIDETVRLEGLFHITILLGEFILLFELLFLSLKFCLAMERKEVLILFYSIFFLFQKEDILIFEVIIIFSIFMLIIREKRYYNLYFFYCAVSILKFNCVNLDNISIGFLIILSYFQSKVLKNEKFIYFIKSHSKRVLIISLIGSFFFSFCAVGNNLFLYAPFWNITLEKIILIFVWSIFFWFEIQFVMFTFYYISNRDTKEEISRKKSIFCIFITSLCFAVFPVLVIDDLILKSVPHESRIEILPLKEKGENSESNEVWVLQIVIDGVSTTFLDMENPVGWEKENEKFIYAGSDKVEPLILYFSPAKNIYVKFLRHGWSGKVKIKDGDFETIWDLSDQNASYFYKVKSNMNYATKIQSYLFYIIFYILSVWIIAKILYIHINKPRIRRFLINFSFCEILFLFYLFLCYPGNCNADIISQYGQAIGVYPLSDGHPILSTLWIRCLLFIHDSLGFIAFTQATGFALCFAFILSVFKRGSIYTRIAMVIHIGVGLFSIHLTKDLWYTIGLLLFSISSILVFSEERKKKRIGCFGIFIGTVLLQIFRHNGIITLWLCFAIFSIGLIKIKKSRILIISLFLSILGGKVILSTIEQYYLDSSIEEKGLGSSLNSFLFYDLYGAHMYTDHLSEETEIMLDDIIAFERGEQEYNVYSSDSFFWSYLKEEYKEGIIPYSEKEIIKTYGKEFYKNMWDLFAIRLKSNNIMWNLFEAEDSFNERIPIGIFKEVDEFGMYNANSNRIEFVNNVIDLTKEIKILDAFFWRYTLMLLAIFCYLLYCIKFMKKEGIFVIPVLCEWVFYMGVLGVQVYRYSFSIICYVICLPYLLVNLKDTEIREEMRNSLDKEI